MFEAAKIALALGNLCFKPLPNLLEPQNKYLV
jgi:hypothetical protein